MSSKSCLHGHFAMVAWRRSKRFQLVWCGRGVSREERHGVAFVQRKATCANQRRLQTASQLHFRNTAKYCPAPCHAGCASIANGSTCAINKVQQQHVHFALHIQSVYEILHTSGMEDGKVGKSKWGHPREEGSRDKGGRQFAGCQRHGAQRGTYHPSQ